MNLSNMTETKRTRKSGNVIEGVFNQDPGEVVEGPLKATYVQSEPESLPKSQLEDRDPLSQNEDLPDGSFNMEDWNDNVKEPEPEPEPKHLSDEFMLQWFLEAAATLSVMRIPADLSVVKPNIHVRVHETHRQDTSGVLNATMQIVIERNRIAENIRLNGGALESRIMEWPDDDMLDYEIKPTDEE